MKFVWWLIVIFSHWDFPIVHCLTRKTLVIAVISSCVNGVLNTNWELWSTWGYFCENRHFVHHTQQINSSIEIFFKKIGNSIVDKSIPSRRIFSSVMYKWQELVIQRNSCPDKVGVNSLWPYVSLRRNGVLRGLMRVPIAPL